MGKELQRFTTVNARTGELVEADVDLSDLAEQLVAQAHAQGIELTGPDGLLTGLTRQTRVEHAVSAVPAPARRGTDRLVQSLQVHGDTSRIKSDATGDAWDRSRRHPSQVGYLGQAGIVEPSVVPSRGRRRGRLAHERFSADSSLDGRVTPGIRQVPAPWHSCCGHASQRMQVPCTRRGCGATDFGKSAAFTHAPQMTEIMRGRATSVG